MPPRRPKKTRSKPPTKKPRAPKKPTPKSTSPAKRSAQQQQHHHGHDHDHDHDHHDHDHGHDHDHHHHGAVRPQPLLAVRNVALSSKWYARLLDGESLREDLHDNVYDRVFSGEDLILQLHAWDEEDHPNLVDKAAAQLGHGVLLWFEVDDFDAAVKRARAMKATIVQKPHVNPGPQHREIWLRDPDGYIVVIASPDGEAS